MVAKPKRRVMVDFRIDEISCVDNPAQKGARAVLLKRDGGNEEEHDDMQFHKITDRPYGYASFEAAVAAIAKAERLPPHEAMSRAAEAYPRLLQEYRDVGDVVAKTIAEAAAPKPVSKAVQHFDDRVSEIAKRDNIPHYQAMAKARERYPEEFDAAFGA
jgi:hypothetical protein